MKTLSPPYSRREASAVRNKPTAEVRRVLHLRTVTGRGGGPEKTILNSPRYIGPGYQMRLAYFRPAGDPDFDLPARAARLGVALIDIPEKGPLDFGALRRLAGEIRDFRPHILHPHDYKTNVLAVLLGRWFRIPIVTTMHGYVTRSPRLWAYYALDRWSLRRADHIVFVSEDLQEHVDRLGISAQHCSLVHNAVDSKAYAPRVSRVEAKRMFGLPSGGLLVGAAGRLSPEKGFSRLIQAADRLMRQGMSFDLVIAGEGVQRKAIESEIANCEAPRRFHLLGHQSDLLPLYTALDVFALSSLREGLPNVLLEAMSMTVPVVATRIAGVPCVVEDGVNGLLVEPGDDSQLAQALRRLLEDATLRRRLAQAGRQTVVERFSFERRMQKIREIYDSVLAERRPR